MSMLSLMEAKLPPGFRFHPRDEELVCDYLAKKVSASNLGAYSSFHADPMMIEVDLNKIEPWDLPELAKVGGKEWYFYSLRDRKYATGLRTNRATLSGYWKATGKDRPVIDRRNGAVSGMRKTLVFYQGRAPKGKKTDWVMHEFRLEGTFDPPKMPFKQEDWVLCRVFHKNKVLPTKIQVHESSSYDDAGSSSSLPSLSDNLLSIDQTPLNLELFEQVPCFSNILTQLNTNIHTLPPIPDHQIERPNIPTSEIAPPKDFQDLGEFLNPISYEKNVIKAVLDRLTKLDSNQKSMEVAPSFGHAASLEISNYLPEMCLSPIWSTQY